MSDVQGSSGFAMTPEQAESYLIHREALMAASLDQANLHQAALVRHMFDAIAATHRDISRMGRRITELALAMDILHDMIRNKG